MLNNFFFLFSSFVWFFLFSHYSHFSSLWNGAKIGRFPKKKWRRIQFGGFAVISFTDNEGGFHNKCLLSLSLAILLNWHLELSKFAFDANQIFWNCANPKKNSHKTLKKTVIELEITLVFFLLKLEIPKVNVFKQC